MLSRRLLHTTQSVYTRAKMSDNIAIIFHHTIFPRAPHPCSHYQNKTSGAPTMINQKKTHYKTSILTLIQKEGPRGGRIMTDAGHFLYVGAGGFIHAHM